MKRLFRKILYKIGAKIIGTGPNIIGIQIGKQRDDFQNKALVDLL